MVYRVEGLLLIYRIHVGPVSIRSRCIRFNLYVTTGLLVFVIGYCGFRVFYHTGN